MTSSFMYVANWKMNMVSLQKAIAFCESLKQDPILSHQIILCPSMIHLYPLIKTYKQILFGAQDCSAHEKGAYTGEIAAQSLAEIGCIYGIIGHSERRTHHGETNSIVAQKMQQLLCNSIIPIVCIGETEKEYLSQKTFTVLEQQLSPILEIIQKNPIQQWCIAYEPIWAIGTGKIPTEKEIELVLQWLESHIKQFNIPIPKLLYGGSVDENTIEKLKRIHRLNGFLVGGASLDFQKFKKIVTLG